MNKKKVIIIVAISLVVALVAGGIVGYLILTRRAVSGNDFKSKMEAATYGEDNEKFEVSDGTSELKETSLVSESLVANRGTAYKIFYTKMKSKQDAINAYAENKKTIQFFEEAGKDNSGKNKFDVVYQKGINYHMYSLNTDTYYYMVSQVGDTFMYVVVDNKFKGEVDGIFTDMGYLK